MLGEDVLNCSVFAMLLGSLRVVRYALLLSDTCIFVKLVSELGHAPLSECDLSCNVGWKINIILPLHKKKYTLTIGSVRFARLTLVVSISLG